MNEQDAKTKVSTLYRRLSIDKRQQYFDLIMFVGIKSIALLRK